MKTLSSQEVKQALWDIVEQLPPAQRHQVLPSPNMISKRILWPVRRGARSRKACECLMNLMRATWVGAHSESPPARLVEARASVILAAL